MELPSYPSTINNRKFIADILNLYLPKNGDVLETASGTGEHICYFGKKFPGLRWQPSDKSSELFWAIRARALEESNVSEPLLLDLTGNNLPVKEKSYDVLLNINMIHIAPWDACLGLFRLAKEVISPDGIIYLYGPFKVGGSHTSESNHRFDISLRDRNSSWGVRNLEDVINIAKDCGFFDYDVHEMPVNNKSVIFKKNNQVNISVKMQKNNSVSTS